MTRRGTVLVPALVASLVGALMVSGCDSDDQDPAEATATLEQQRDDVRAATSELQEAAAQALGGQVRSSSGQWRGCETGGLEEYRSFRYQASARIDVGAGTPRPYLDQLRDVFETAGFEASEEGARPGGQTLSAERDGIGATFSELPDQGDYVLLSVAGDCVDVPEDERDDWLTRDEPDPEIR